MSVEGLRAWMGEVERKLGKRTRAFLALTVIAIGIAGASLYLAIDARNSSVSESDVRALQEEIEMRIAETATTTPAVPPVESEPTPAPQPQESQPKQEGNESQGSGSDSGSGGASSESTAPKSSSGGEQDKSARILELLEQTKQQNAEAEAEQNAK
jgi:hypothetical protein